MTDEVRKKGLLAEQRVVKVAQNEGLSARSATPQEDYANKTDVVIEGQAFQVSVSGKSRSSQRNLEKNGIIAIEAGSHVSDTTIISKIWNALLGN